MRDPAVFEKVYQQAGDADECVNTGVSKKRAYSPQPALPGTGGVGNITTARPAGEPRKRRQSPAGRGCAASVLEVDRGKLDLWPEHVLGCKPALPDQRLPTHPCRHLSRGKLPVSGGRWAQAAELPASGRNWGSAEPARDETNAASRRVLALGAYDAWDNSVVSVFMDLVELVCCGLDGTQSTTPQPVSVETRSKWLRSLRNGDRVRAVRQWAGEDTCLEHREQQLQVAIATIVGWHPGTQFVRLSFPTDGNVSSSERFVRSWTLRTLAEDQTMRHHVQPIGPSTNFDTFSATERRMPRAMERVYVCVEVRTNNQTETDRGTVSLPSSGLEGSHLYATNAPGVAGGNAAMKDGSKLLWVPGYVSKADVTSQRVWVRILGLHECDLEPLHFSTPCVHFFVCSRISIVFVVATSPYALIFLYQVVLKVGRTYGGCVCINHCLRSQCNGWSRANADSSRCKVVRFMTQIYCSAIFKLTRTTWLLAQRQPHTELPTGAHLRALHTAGRTNSSTDRILIAQLTVRPCFWTRTLHLRTKSNGTIWHRRVT